MDVIIVAILFLIWEWYGCIVGQWNSAEIVAKSIKKVSTTFYTANEVVAFPLSKKRYCSSR